jgi:hypothetical protein
VPKEKEISTRHKRVVTIDVMVAYDWIGMAYTAIPQ